MVKHTIVALFDRAEEAHAAVADLEAAGLRPTDLSLVANNGDNRYGTNPPAWGAETASGEETENRTGEGAGTGAAIGALLAGGAGLLAGVGALAIPGIGPVVAAGVLASTLAGLGVGAVAGGLVGSLVGSGISREHADIYAEAVRRGGTLLTVQTEEGMEDQVEDILERHEPIDVEERAASWRQTGWTRFDESAEPFSDIGAPILGEPTPAAASLAETADPGSRLHPAVTPVASSGRVSGTSGTEAAPAASLERLPETAPMPTGSGALDTRSGMENQTAPGLGVTAEEEIARRARVRRYPLDDEIATDRL